MAQLRVLYRLNRDPGMTAGALAALLGVRPSTVTGIVDRLVSQDLVERQADPDDRRLVRTVVTQHANQVLLEFTRANRVYILSIFQRLSDEELHEAAQGLTLINRAAQQMGVQVRADPSGRYSSPMP